MSIIDNTSASDWNEYLGRQGVGCLFHRAEWRRALAVYKVPLIRLAAVQKGRIVGVLPLAWQRSWVFGSHLVSLPWFDAAGVVADNAQIAEMLIEAALSRGRAMQIRTIHLRQVAPTIDSQDVRSDKVQMRLALGVDSEALWRRLSPKVRNQIRKAQKSGLEVLCGGVELLDEFFHVYARNMRDLGSPSHHRRFFAAVWDAFAKETHIYVVRLGQHTIGAGWSMSNGDVLEIPWASSLRNYGSYCVNHLMYWHILVDACREGFRQFNFGRSSYGSGTYQFKKQWGAEPAQLYWYSLPVGANAPSRPTPEGYGWATRIWKRLPVWLTQRVGPKVIGKVA